MFHIIIFKNDYMKFGDVSHFLVGDFGKISP